MADRETLLTLALRCERATEGSDALDEAISCAIYPELRQVIRIPPGTAPTRVYWEMHGERVRIMDYSTSLDAALALVPEGWGAKMEYGLGHGNEVTVGHVGAAGFYDRPEQWAKAATLALAMCAAALRARAQETPR